MTVERSRVRKRGRGSNRARPDSRDSEARSKKLESVQSSRKKKKVGGCCGESGEEEEVAGGPDIYGDLEGKQRDNNDDEHSNGEGFHDANSLKQTKLQPIVCCDCVPTVNSREYFGYLCDLSTDNTGFQGLCYQMKGTELVFNALLG